MGKDSSHEGPAPQKHNITTIIHLAAKTGVAGASAMVIQVFSLMWMRTTMNYQYRHGGSIIATLSKLYAQGGVVRFYRGIVPALVIGPVSRFGDTACNSFSTALFSITPSLDQLPIFMQTSVGSLMAGCWRLSALPFDAWKTAKQVYGVEGLKILLDKFRSQGVSAFYQGGVAWSMSSIVSHYPWYVSNNYLEHYLPGHSFREEPLRALVRSAGIGFVSQLFSDCASNWLRVIKTYKQTTTDYISYRQVVGEIVAKDGIQGLFLRGLNTKLASNAVQGIIFKITWKYLEERFSLEKT